ncbi:MAG: DMT family transporter [Candidatus Dormibacterales bacterium]
MSERGGGAGVIPYLALAGLAFVWGLSFFFIKVAVGGGAMSPAALVLIRVGSATLTLAAVFAVTRRDPMPATVRRSLSGLFWMAVFSTVIPFMLIAWGELSVTSGTASILNATTPLWTAVLAYRAVPAERPTRLNYAGVAVGFAGTAVLVAPDLARHGLSGTTLGMLAVTGGAASYAVGAILQRRRLAGVPVLEASLWQALLATCLIIPFAVPTLPHARLSAGPLLAALALGVGGTAVAYILYYYLLNTLGATRASAVTFLLPVTAVIWGAALLHEVVTVFVLAGMAVILGGVFLTTRRGSRQSRPWERGARPGPLDESAGGRLGGR